MRNTDYPSPRETNDIVPSRPPGPTGPIMHHPPPEARHAATINLRTRTTGSGSTSVRTPPRLPLFDLPPPPPPPPPIPFSPANVPLPGMVQQAALGTNPNPPSPRRLSRFVEEDEEEDGEDFEGLEEGMGMLVDE
ncbi:unnamed protein product [Zymoseptoria tritici ST99CH_1E4]|uniref:Uncharacterized protein n=1 Tax=Zymoseptoria tritici ST99CH_1E4 TaxID=1276532 RepID=A0A2H1GU64_ZYMTR|nr:unnamed protein product [Zymoseptoria tritici ST99CH_1E4]